MQWVGHVITWEPTTAVLGALEIKTRSIGVILGRKVSNVAVLVRLKADWR